MVMIAFCLIPICTYSGLHVLTEPFCPATLAQMYEDAASVNTEDITLPHVEGRVAMHIYKNLDEFTADISKVCTTL